MKNYVFLIPLALFLLAGCQQKTDHQHPTQEKYSTSHPAENGLRLDDGNKWKANAETTTGILEMQQIMQRFEQQDNKNYDMLHGQLETELQEIIRQCTMKGESHEQLHHFLEPLMGHMRQLKEEQAPETRQDAARAISRQLTSYTDFFE